MVDHYVSVDIRNVLGSVSLLCLFVYICIHYCQTYGA